MDDLITVIYGGPSPEHEISILTGLQCERVLAASGAKVQSIYHDKSGSWFIVPPNTEARDYLNGAPPSAAELTLRLGGPEAGWSRKRGLRSVALEVGTILNCFHGGWGEGGGAQGLFALIGVPATGGTVYSSALGMDKFAFSSVLRSAGVPTLERVLLHESIDPEFAGPYIVKPRFGGSSIGIEVVSDLAAARTLLKASAHLRAGAVIEPFRSDLFDLNISFRTYPEFATSAIERPLKQSENGIYSYQEKYLHSAGLTSAPRELPAVIPDDLAHGMRELSRKVAQLTGIDGVARVDFLTDGEQLFVNEINSIPGAMALFLWTDTPAATVLLDAVAEARANPRITPIDGHGQGAALQAAGGIAGKLTGLGVHSESGR